MSEGRDTTGKHHEAPALGAGTWALADQGVVSVGNFLSNVLLARSLPPVEYGIFSLIYGIILFLNSIHSSLITYPLTIHGAPAPIDKLRQMVGRSLQLTVFMGAVLSLVLAGVLWALHRIWVIPCALAALLLWQMQETVRRGLLAHQRFREAFGGDGICYLGQAAAIWILSEAKAINLEYAFGVIAATSLLAGYLQLNQLRPRFGGGVSLPLSVADFWLLGRWVLMINLLNLLTFLFFPWMLMFFRGAEHVAAFQAVGNIMAVANPVIFWVGNVMLPASAKVHLAHGVHVAWQSSRITAVRGLVLLAPYFAAALLWPDRFLSIFYGSDSPYCGLGWLVRILVLACACNYVAQTVGTFLNAVKGGRSAFQAQAASAVAVLLLGPPLVLWAGVAGAVWGTTVMNGVRASLSVGSLSRKLKRVFVVQ